MSYFQGMKWIDTLGATNAFDNIDGAPKISTMSREYSIAEGTIAGYSAWGKLGVNNNIGTTELTLGPAFTADYVFPPTAGEQMSVRSSSATDTAAGVGARTITLYYLDASNVAQEETITLNGTTYVDTVATNIRRINNCRVITVGTNGSPTGNITIQDKTTRAVTYGYITLGKNRMRQAIWTVPAGKTLYIAQANVYGVAGSLNKLITINMMSSYNEKAGTVHTTGKQFYTMAEASMSMGQIISPYTIPIKLPATTDLKVNAIATSASSTAEISLRGWYE